MKLDIQIYSFIYSFIFGIIFYFLLDVYNKLVDKIKRVFKFFISIIFILLIGCIYFWGLLFINNGVIHVYFLLSVLVGYIFVYKVILSWFTHLRKK